MGDEAEQPRGVDVADELQAVLGAVGQLVDVDEQRVQAVELFAEQVIPILRRAEIA